METTTARIPTNTLERAGPPEAELREQWNEGTPDGGLSTEPMRTQSSRIRPLTVAANWPRRGSLGAEGEKLSVAGCVDCDGMKSWASRRAARHSATAADSADSLVGPPSPWMLSRVAGAALRGEP